jgi:hypothetical protein
MSDEELLNGMVTTLKGFITREQKSRGVYASGKSARSLRTEANPKSGKLYGVHYFTQQEYGRGPTKTDVASTPTLRERILSWLDDKGINPTDITKKSLAFIIARKIHNEGNRLYRKLKKGEGNKAVEVGIEEGIRFILKKYKPELKKRIAATLKSDIIKGIK